MFITFLTAMVIIIILALVLSNKQKRYKNPLNPKCDRKDCNGCQYYNHNVCKKETKQE